MVSELRLGRKRCESRDLRRLLIASRRRAPRHHPATISCGARVRRRDPRLRESPRHLNDRCWSSCSRLRRAWRERALVTQAVGTDNDVQLAKYATRTTTCSSCCTTSTTAAATRPGGEPGVVRRAGAARHAAARPGAADPRDRRLRLRLERRRSATVGSEMTFQDVMSACAARGHAVARRCSIRWRSIHTSTWTDPDSTDHVAWYLDAVTAYNQMLVGDAPAPPARAVWRLGSEDPAHLARDRHAAIACRRPRDSRRSRRIRCRSSTATARCSHLAAAARPTAPRRSRWTRRRGLVRGEQVTSVPVALGGPAPAAESRAPRGADVRRRTRRRLDADRSSTRSRRATRRRRSSSSARTSRAHIPIMRRLSRRGARDRQPHLHASEPRATSRTS